MSIATTFTFDDPKVKILDWTFNFLGYIPVVSSFSGAIRKIYGIVRIAIAIFGAIFAPYTVFMAQMAFSGIYHFIRGNVEIFPIIGNIMCIAFDLVTLSIP